MQDLGRFLRDYKELIGLPKGLPKIRALKLQPHTVEGRVGMHKASIRWNSNADYLTFSCTCKSARNSICKHILALAVALKTKKKGFKKEGKKDGKERQ